MKPNPPPHQPLDEQEADETWVEVSDDAGSRPPSASVSLPGLPDKSALEPPGSDLDEPTARALSRVDRDARQLLEHTQQTHRGVVTRFTKKGRQLLRHESALLRTLYEERERALSAIVQTRREELRSMLDAFLRVHGTRLEVATTQELVRQRQRFESELERYSETFQQRMVALYGRLDGIRDARVKRIVERDVERLVSGYVRFNDQLDTRFQQVLERSVQA